MFNNFDINQIIQQKVEESMSGMRDIIKQEVEKILKDITPIIETEVWKVIECNKPIVEQEVHKVIEGTKPIVEQEVHRVIDDTKSIIKEQTDRVEKIINSQTDKVINQIEPVIEGAIEAKINDIVVQITQTTNHQISIIIEQQTKDIIEQFNKAINEQSALGIITQEFLEINSKLCINEFNNFKNTVAQLSELPDTDISHELLNKHLNSFIAPLIETSKNLHNLLIVVNNLRNNQIPKDIFKLLEEPVKNLFSKSKEATELLHKIEKKINGENDTLKIALFQLENINYDSVVIQELVNGNDININGNLEDAIIKKYDLSNHNHTYNEFEFNAPAYGVAAIVEGNQNVYASEQTKLLNDVADKIDELTRLFQQTER